MEDKAGSGSVQRTVPLLCAKGCGFYGSPTTLNMCSKCFRANQKQLTNTAATASPSSAQAAVTDAAGAAKELDAASKALVGMNLVQSVTAAAAASSDAENKPANSDAAVPRLGSVVRSALSASNLAASMDAAADRSRPQTPLLVSREVAVAAEASSNDAASDLVAGAATAAAAAKPEGDALGSSGDATVTVASGADQPEGSPARKIQKNTGRCWSCRKKVGLLGFKCRCDYTFCSEHRHSDKHACDFDYKTLGKANLEKANPQVVASKLAKI